MADEDPECVLPKLREQAHGSCVSVHKSYEACVERIKAKGHGECEPYYFDYLKCVDKNSIPKIFSHLK